MNAGGERMHELERRLAEAEATVRALLAGEVDAVIDAASQSPMLLSRAHAALRESEAQYRQIVETTSDGIIKLDLAGQINFVNVRFAEMLGYEPDEMTGRNLFGFMSAEAQAIVTEALRIRVSGPAQTFDSTVRHKNGTDIPVNVAGSALLDAMGRRVGHLGMVRNITERNRLQSQLMVSDRMASVGTLAAGVAHEINNPLAAVIANLDFIVESMRTGAHSDQASGPPGRSAAWMREEINGPLADAREAAQRMRVIVRDLKVFSRAPEDALQGPVDVRQILDSSLRMAANEIRHRAHVVTHYGAVPSVQANEARLGQVFLNLLVNAAQALPDGHAEHNSIHVSTRLDGPRVVIEVRDTGPGIPPAIIGRIFDAFFTTKDVGSGTGLGLAISHRIITDMGGTLTVESTVGQGTTFRVALPVAAPAKVDVAQKADTVGAVILRGRILVVDDEASLLRVLTLTLSRDHEVVAAATATEALALITAGEHFDLVLCDLMMPEMTGMDLHRQLSCSHPDQATRMIFLTGGAFTPEAQRFLADDHREYIEKPFDSANLRAIIQRHLRAHP